MITQEKFIREIKEQRNENKIKVDEWVGKCNKLYSWIATRVVETKNNDRFVGEIVKYKNTEWYITASSFYYPAAFIVIKRKKLGKGLSTETISF